LEEVESGHWKTGAMKKEMREIINIGWTWQGQRRDEFKPK